MAVQLTRVGGRAGLPNPFAGADDGRRNRTIVAALLVAAMVYPFVANAVPSVLPAPTVNNLIVMCYYAMLALGLNIVVGFAGLLDLGYVAFYVFGAYTTAFLASPQFGIHVPWFLIAPIAILAAALAGILLGTPTLRLRGDYLAIVTLGFGEIVPQLMRNLDKVCFLVNRVLVAGGTVLLHLETPTLLRLPSRLVIPGFADGAHQGDGDALRHGLLTIREPW